MNRIAYKDGSSTRTSSARTVSSTMVKNVSAVIQHSVRIAQMGTFGPLRITLHLASWRLTRQGVALAQVFSVIAAWPAISKLASQLNKVLPSSSMDKWWSAPPYLTVSRGAVRRRVAPSASKASTWPKRDNVHLAVKRWIIVWRATRLQSAPSAAWSSL